MRVLEFSGFRVVSLLPRKLPDETISKPDEENNDEIRVIQVGLVFQDVPASEVSMHQCPRLVHGLALNDVLDHFTQFASQRQHLGVQSLLRCLQI